MKIKLSSKGYGGEADPEFIELRNISDRKLFGFLGWEIGLLHEMLHLWSAKSIGEVSLSGAAKTSDMKRDHYFLIYHGDFVAGMILDHQIRAQSDSEFTLDDLIACEG